MGLAALLVAVLAGTAAVRGAPVAYQLYTSDGPVRSAPSDTAAEADLPGHLYEHVHDLPRASGLPEAPAPITFKAKSFLGCVQTESQSPVIEFALDPSHDVGAMCQRKCAQLSAVYFGLAHADAGEVPSTNCACFYTFPEDISTGERRSNFADARLCARTCSFSAFRCGEVPAASLFRGTPNYAVYSVGAHGEPFYCMTLY